MLKITSFTQLIAWQHAHLLVLEIYKITRLFPSEERFGLSDQIRRASVSITSNIAEGFYRRTAADKSHFFCLSVSSLGEVQNQIIIARDLTYITHNVYGKLFADSVKVQRLINGLIKFLR